MQSMILSVLGVEPSVYYFDQFNLYHNGDERPFANLFLKDGEVTLRVNSGETCEKASKVNLGRYAKH